jgi:hypothetical protein
MIATVHFIKNKWVALPILTVDFFAGTMQPNEHHIINNCIAFVQNTDTSKFTENQMVIGCVHYRYDEYCNEYQVFEIKELDLNSHIF